MTINWFIKLIRYIPMAQDSPEFYSFKFNRRWHNCYKPQSELWPEAGTKNPARLFSTCRRPQTAGLYSSF